MSNEPSVSLKYMEKICLTALFRLLSFGLYPQNHYHEKPILISDSIFPPYAPPASVPPLGGGGLMAQSPVTITYNVAGNLNANALSQPAINAAPKECIIDFHFSAPNVRVVMESLDGQTNYVDRVFGLNVHANPDSTYLYGKPGAWTIGLGQFSNVSEFRVKLLNPLSATLNTAVAQGSYP